MSSAQDRLRTIPGSDRSSRMFAQPQDLPRKNDTTWVRRPPPQHGRGTCAVARGSPRRAQHRDHSPGRYAFLTTLSLLARGHFKTELTFKN